MRKNNINLRILFITLFSIIIIINTNAQSGLNFQGVARSNNNIILASQAITIKLSILQGSALGTAEYTETRRVNTNAQGLFTAVIGDTGAISTLGNFSTINWKNTPKFLKIEMDAAAGTNFITMGTTQFQYVAYAQFAKSVDAENITGIVPVARGGTGTNNLSDLKSVLLLEKVNNTADVDKPISLKVQTALDLKLSASDTSKYTKKTYIDSALLTKITITGNAATATKLATARKINGVDFDGSEDITTTVLSDAGTLTGTTLKSTVTNSSLTSVGTLGNLTVSNPILGSISGNAATATKLATARKINGVDFDGTEDITIDKLKAGDEFGGGIVFYTWANGKHGLIAAMDDLKISGTDAWNWSSLTNINTMAKSNGIGAGYKNMLLILSRQGLEAGPYAASVCNEFKIDLGYQNIDPNAYGDNTPIISDWYLPSIYELKLIDDFALQYAGNDPNPNWRWWTGSSGYWSSTEFNAANAFYLGYECGNGCITTYSSVTKTALGHVRPIRMF